MKTTCWNCRNKFSSEYIICDRCGELLSNKPKWLKQKRSKNMYVLIENYSSPLEMDSERSDIIGMFETQKQAKEAIVNDAMSNVDGSELNVGRNEDWGSTYYICKIGKAWKPVPVIDKVDIELERVEV